MLFLLNLSWDVLTLSQVTFIYIAPLTIQIVTKHCNFKHFKHQHFFSKLLSCRIVLQINNFMLTRLLVNRLLVNIAYSLLPKIWVHLTSVLKKPKKKS